MKIYWLKEDFEDDLTTWTTEFLDFEIVISKGPRSGLFETSINDSLVTGLYVTESLTLEAAMEWGVHYIKQFLSYERNVNEEYF